MTDLRRRLAAEALGTAMLVAAVIVHDKATNRVVLLQRSQNAKFAQGMWDLPVGKSEPGEPITETAVRELYEETGLTVKPESLKVAHIIHGAWGVADANDFLEPVDALVAEGLADPDRLAVTGYSYGGFMTCWVTGRDHRFKAAVARGRVRGPGRV